MFLTLLFQTLLRKNVVCFRSNAVTKTKKQKIQNIQKHERKNGHHYKGRVRGNASSARTKRQRHKTYSPLKHMPTHAKTCQHIHASTCHVCTSTQRRTTRLSSLVRPTNIHTPLHRNLSRKSKTMPQPPRVVSSCRVLVRTGKMAQFYRSDSRLCTNACVVYRGGGLRRCQRDGWSTVPCTVLGPAFERRCLGRVASFAGV